MIRWYINRWVGPFRLLFFKGSHSWEFQIARHVFQWRHTAYTPEHLGFVPSHQPRFNHFTDPYGIKGREPHRKGA